MEELNFMPEKSRQQIEAENFVETNIVKANDSRVECGDGRYRSEQSQGAIRAFGADFGIIMAIAGTLKKEGITLNPDKIVSTYVDSVKDIRGEDARIYFHTDSSHPIPEIGCGHIKKASSKETEELYAPLVSDEVSTLYESFIVNERSRVTTLEGDHKEKAVLLVYGSNYEEDPKFSVNSSDGEGNMYFVVDMQRTGRFIKKVFPHFSKGLTKYVPSDKVIQTYLDQMGSTASLLASNLDQFKVNISDDGDSSLTQLAKVGSIA
jgi:hypothetical protein